MKFITLAVSASLVAATGAAAPQPRFDVLISGGMVSDGTGTATIADRATFEKPHQFAAGMKHVLVNGRLVLKDDEHTGATPGRALKGPGAARRP